MGARSTLKILGAVVPTIKHLKVGQRDLSLYHIYRRFRPMRDDKVTHCHLHYAWRIRRRSLARSRTCDEFFSLS